MDKKTIAAYDSKATKYAEDWLNQNTPQEIHHIVSKYFHAKSATADIGCGSGRDTFWLSQNAFPTIGYDASQKLLAFAKAKFPMCRFKYSVLPSLQEIKSESFNNVLCETVFQHLPIDTHLNALDNLFRILCPKGILSLTIRHPINTIDDREKDERLYVVVDLNALKKRAAELGASLLFEKTIDSPSSGKTISQLVFMKL